VRAGGGVVGVGLIFRRPIPRSESFGGGLLASNAASEDVRGLRARFVTRVSSGDCLHVRFERRVGGIVPTLRMDFLRFLISSG